MMVSFHRDAPGLQLDAASRATAELKGMDHVLAAAEEALGCLTDEASRFRDALELVGKRLARSEDLVIGSALARIGCQVSA